MFLVSSGLSIQMRVTLHSAITAALVLSGTACLHMICNTDFYTAQKGKDLFFFLMDAWILWIKGMLPSNTDLESNEENEMGFIKRESDPNLHGYLTYNALHDASGLANLQLPLLKAAFGLEFGDNVPAEHKKNGYWTTPVLSYFILIIMRLERNPL